MNSETEPHGFEPIAIVGMGCRFASNSSSPSKLWDMLKEGRSGQSEFPKNRLNIDSWYNPSKGRPGSLYSRGGYFLSHDDSYREFDPSFFGISPLEATSMDPQQRKLLEVVFECFESAGKTLEDMSGSETACYVGCFSTDFEHIQIKDPEYSLPYQSTGSGLTILSNRINYAFNLKGPSFTVDTACSSSLYALHLACQSLLAGDCTAAIVGGSSLIASVEKHIGSGRLGILSPTSTCHTFDASADGFGRGDGIAALYIKRLSSALADGDPIRAVIRSTAINSNGKGHGINYPGSEAQEAVIRKAYARAGLDFSQTGYFECHGTGTPVGDPIECAAIGRVFAESRTADNPLLIGSVKTNLGHCEGASGLAAIIKTVLSLEKACIPATVGVTRLNPKIDFRGGRLKVVTSLTEWPGGMPYRRASVNGFGYGGANAHVVLDAADSFLNNKRHSSATVNGVSERKHCVGKKYLLAFSAHDQTTLKKNIKALSEVASNYDALDFAHTLAVRHSKLEYRGFSISDGASLPARLEESHITFGTPRNVAPGIGFVFTGQGAQWPQMGYTLIQHFPSVRQTLEKLEESLAMLPTPPDFSIIDVLSAPKESSTIYHSIRSPVCCTAVQVAIVVLLDSWGIRPTAVVGHSAGEIAAAFAAGLITGAEAVAIAYYRGLAVLKCKVDGAMLAVGVGPKDVLPYLEGQPDAVIGCYNSPQSVTLSGAEVAIDNIKGSLVKAGILALKVNSSGNAYHSHLMKAAGQEFRDLFETSYTEMLHSPTRRITLPRTPIYSCVNGKLIVGDTLPFNHWRMSLEKPVLFDQATQLLLTTVSKVNHLIEIGPHSALAGPIRHITSSLGFDQARLKYLPTLIRGRDGVDDILRLAGTLFTVDYPVNLSRVNSIEVLDRTNSDEVQYKTGKPLVDLPSYQWNYEDLLWKESRWGQEFRFRQHCRHDLLGSREPGGSRNSHLWRNHLRLDFVPWLRDHKIGDDIIFPAAGYIAIAIEALNQVAEDRGLLVDAQGYTIQGLKIDAALIIPVEGSVETLLNMRELSTSSRESSKWFDFRVSSVTEDGKWSEHAAGMIGLVEPELNVRRRIPLPARTKSTNGSKWYAALSAVGVEFGPAFQTLSDIKLEPEKHEAIAQVALHTTKDIMIAESRYIVHPTTLDGCLQLSVMAAHGSSKSTSKAFLPVSIEELTIWTPNHSVPMFDKATIYAQGQLHGLRSVHGTAEVVDDNGNPLLQGKVSFLSLEGSLIKSRPEIPRQPYSRLIWKPDVDRLGNFSMQNTSSSGDLQLTDLLDLIRHKGRPMKILQFGTENMNTVVKVLGGESSEPLYSHYIIVAHIAALEQAKEFSTNKNLELRDLYAETGSLEQRFGSYEYDLVIISEVPVSAFSLSETLKKCKPLIKPSGKLVMNAGICDLFSQRSWTTYLAEAGLTLNSLNPMDTIEPESIVVASIPEAIQNGLESPGLLWLVYLQNPHQLSAEIEIAAKSRGFSITSVPLLHAPKVIPKGSRIIMTAELERSLLTQMSHEELAALQYIVKHVSSAIWITNVGTLDGHHPEKSLASGFAKTLMTEQPSFRLCCFDIHPRYTDPARSAALILDQEVRLQRGVDSEVEMNLVEKDGLVYISRFVPDDVENAEFERRANPPVEKGVFRPDMELDFHRVGQIDSFYYKQKGTNEGSRTLKPDEVRLEPSAHSLSAAEASILKGQQESEFFSHECVAIVLETGSEVTNLKPGDRVISLSPGKFDSSLIAASDSCYKLLADERPQDLAGLFVPTCTALYALKHLSRVRQGQVVLVHNPGDHLLATAFLKIGQQMGLKILITYTSDQAKEYFLRISNIPEDYLIPATTANLIGNFENLGIGRGIDLIAASAATTGHQDLWKRLNRNGKYLLVGTGSKVPDLGLFHKSVFARGASITSFDLWDMLREEPQELKDLLHEAFDLYRRGILSSFPQASRFDIAQLENAVSAAFDTEDFGRVVLECKPSSIVPVRVANTPISFNSSATYLMIGCLGGLGRSLTNWMVSRSARHFIFLSRSGAKKPEAAALLKNLKSFAQRNDAGVTFEIVHGDVSVRADVDKAIAAAKTPIKGVIQAAAVFQDCLFENMILEKFNAVLDSKVQGTVNLHEALLNEPLDFFVMTSSALGIKAPAGESNYAAANAFLDSMARHRWSLGLQGTSLALGMVQEIGHVEEHPEIEAVILQSGLYGIDEAEFLTMMELACRPRDHKAHALSKWDVYSNAQIVTGLEMNRMKVSPPARAIWLQDKRLQYVATGATNSTTSAVTSDSDTSSLLSAAFKSGGASAVKHAVKEIILKQFSKLVLVPVEKLELGVARPLADFGMDSMVSSEMRALAWREFRADVPFMRVLEKGMSVGELADLVWNKMDGDLKGAIETA